MSDPLPSAAGQEPFRLGRVVARSFAIWGRELLVLLVLAALIHAPRVALVEAFQRAWPFPPGPVLGRGATSEWAERLNRWIIAAVPRSLTESVLQGFFRDLSIGVVIFAVYARLRGERRRVAECVRGGLRRFLPVLRVSLSLTLLRTALAYGTAIMLWNGLLRPAWGWRIVAALGLVRVGLPLVLSPFWVAVPAAVLEEPTRPLRRSWRLTRGHRLGICSMILLLYALDWSSTRLLHFGLDGTHLPWLARKGIWWTQDLLVVSLSAVLAAVGYHALRLEKEGVDVSKLAEIFA